MKRERLDQILIDYNVPYNVRIELVDSILDEIEKSKAPDSTGTAEAEDPADTIARLGKELGVTGTAAVFREALRLAKQASADARALEPHRALARLVSLASIGDHDLRGDMEPDDGEDEVSRLYRTVLASLPAPAGDVLGEPRAQEGGDVLKRIWAQCRRLIAGNETCKDAEDNAQWLLAGILEVYATVDRAVTAVTPSAPIAASVRDDGYSKDFQLMLVRIIQRHRNGRDLTDTLKGAEDLLKRKGSLSPFRSEDPAPAGDVLGEAQTKLST